MADVAALLYRWQHGDKAALDEMLPARSSSMRSRWPRAPIRPGTIRT